MKFLNLLSGQGLLLATAGLVIGGGAMVSNGTLAGFQAQTANNSNVFNAGILRMGNVAGTAVNGTSDCATTNLGTLTGTCAQLFKAVLRAPGDSSANTVAITNTGTVDGLLTLALGTVSVAQVDTTTAGAPACSAGSITAYPGQIGLTLSDGTNTYGPGTLAVPPSTLASVPLAAGATKTYTVTLSFTSTGAATTDNPLQNCGASFPLTWTLDQRAGLSNASGA
jgi:hypothetical protein